MQYPIVIHKDKGSDFGVIVPDLPGCFSAGATVDEAMLMAREAIELHLEGLIEGGQPAPGPSGIEKHRNKPDYKDGVWALVSIDPSTLRVGAKRVNVSIPERVLDAMDRLAEREGETRSGLLVQAVTHYIGRSGEPSMTRARRRGRPKGRKTKA